MRNHIRFRSSALLALSRARAAANGPSCRAARTDALARARPPACAQARDRRTDAQHHTRTQARARPTVCNGRAPSAELRVRRRLAPLGPAPAPTLLPYALCTIESTLGPT